MLVLEQMMSIKILHEQGLNNRAIVKQLKISRNTVRRYLENYPVVPTYTPRPLVIQKLDPYKGYLCERVEATRPDWIPATVLFKEIGYERGITRLRHFIHNLKPSATVSPLIRFETEPGKQMQVDWAEFRRAQPRLSAFIATLGYSRFSYVEFVADERLNTL